MNKKNFKIFNSIISLCLVTALAFIFLFAGGVSAQSAKPDQLYSIKDIMSNSKVSATSTHTITFVTPTGVSASSTIILHFQDGFDFTTANVNNIRVNGQMPVYGESSTIWQAVFSGSPRDTITFTAPSNINPVVAPFGTVTITFNNYNDSFVNPSVVGPYMINVSGTFGDVGAVQVNILDDGQVHVTGKVQEILKFSIDDNKLGFGSFTSGGPRFATPSLLGASTSSLTTGNSITVGTNAVNGYIMSYSGTTLTSPSHSITPAGSTATTSKTGTEQFGIYIVKSGSGTATIAPAYDGILSGGIAFTPAGAQIVSSGGVPSDDNIFKVEYLANIRNITPAGDYATTLTYTVAVNF